MEDNNKKMIQTSIFADGEISLDELNRRDKKRTVKYRWGKNNLNEYVVSNESLFAYRGKVYVDKQDLLNDLGVREILPGTPEFDKIWNDTPVERRIVASSMGSAYTPCGYRADWVNQNSYACTNNDLSLEEKKRCIRICGKNCPHYKAGVSPSLGVTTLTVPLSHTSGVHISFKCPVCGRETDCLEGETIEVGEDNVCPICIEKFHDMGLSEELCRATSLGDLMTVYPDLVVELENTYCGHHDCGWNGEGECDKDPCECAYIHDIYMQKLNQRG